MDTLYFATSSSLDNTSRLQLITWCNTPGPPEMCARCEGTDDVVGVKAPLRAVAQVVLHGVQVVEVGVQVGVHQDRGEEEDAEGQVEVEREVEEIREPHMCNLA